MLRKLQKIINKKKQHTHLEYIPVLHGSLLFGRCAMITGGTRGIGLKIAEAFLKNGATIVITGRTADSVSNAKKQLRKLNESYKDKILGFCWNNEDNDYESKFNSILSQLGDNKIDILVNNAGIMNGCDYFDVSDENFTKVIKTNLKAPFFISQIVSKYMIDNHIEGNVLNIASSSSLRPADSPYGISKWGVRGFTIGLAEKLLPYGIVVNGLAPGPTATDMLNANDISLNLPSKPLGRYILPEEIANLAVILVSSLGRTVIGDIVYATGGAGILTEDSSFRNYR